MNDLALIPKISPDKVLEIIPEEFCANCSSSDIEELGASSPNKFCRKRIYKLKRSSGPNLLLVLGKKMQHVYDNSQFIYEKIKKITCRPIFIINTNNNYNLFAQEYFEGKPLDQLLDESIIGEREVELIIKDVIFRLSEIEVPSTKIKMESEFHNFVEYFLSNTALRDSDREITRLDIVPHLKVLISEMSSTQRWSSGDLIARNLLVDKNLNYKIIDCEFAHETHFHGEDWIRFATYASERFRSLSFVRELYNTSHPALKVYHLLRQTLLNRKVHSGKDYEHHLQLDLCKAIKRLIESNASGSRILNGFNQQLEVELKRQGDQAVHVSNLETTISDIQNEISEKSTLLDQKDKDVHQLVKSVETLTADLQKSYSTAENLIAEIAKNQATIENLTAEIAKNQAIIHDQLSLLQSQEESMAKLENAVEGKSKENTDLRKQNDGLDKEISILDNRIIRMKNSFSWRSTMPLRFLRRKFLDPWCRRSSNEIPSEDSIEITRDYSSWVKQYDIIDSPKMDDFRSVFESLEDKPLFSIIMPVYNPESHFLERALQSVMAQVYTNWELCITDDHSTLPHVRKILERYADEDPRVKVQYNLRNCHISETSNKSLEISKGKFVVLMDHDDEIRPHSLLRLAQVYNQNPSVCVIYTDEDKIDEHGNRSCPYFKPDWNPDLILSQNYMCHLFCASRELVLSAGKFRKGFEGSQDWDLTLRLIEKAKEDEIFHIPEILYHWRIHDQSVADKIDNKSYAVKAAHRAVKDHLKRTKIPAEIEVSQQQFFRINRLKRAGDDPLVTLIIPTKNNVQSLKECVESVLYKTDYKNFEVSLIDNQSTESKALEYYEELNRLDPIALHAYDQEFNYSAINNFAVSKSQGEIIVFLNDDTVVKNQEWLTELVSQASREEIGAVGAKLLYPDETYQHAGIVLGYCTVAGEMMKGMPKDHPGQMQRANLVHNVSAVTGACMAVSKKKFLDVGGFDENNLKVAFNDVDICLKLQKKGLRNLYTPHAVLYHHESKSRGKEDTLKKKLRFESEIEYMIATWGDLLHNDPSYNPNLSLEWKEQFEPAFPPRRFKFET